MYRFNVCGLQFCAEVEDMDPLRFLRTKSKVIIFPSIRSFDMKVNKNAKTCYVAPFRHEIGTNEPIYNLDVLACSPTFIRQNIARSFHFEMLTVVTRARDVSDLPLSWQDSHRRDCVHATVISFVLSERLEQQELLMFFEFVGIQRDGSEIVCETAIDVLPILQERIQHIDLSSIPHTLSTRLNHTVLQFWYCPLNEGKDRIRDFGVVSDWLAGLNQSSMTQVGELIDDEVLPETTTTTPAYPPPPPPNWSRSQEKDNNRDSRVTRSHAIDNKLKAPPEVPKLATTLTPSFSFPKAGSTSKKGSGAKDDKQAIRHATVLSPRSFNAAVPAPVLPQESQPHSNKKAADFKGAVFTRCEHSCVVSRSTCSEVLEVVHIFPLAHSALLKKYKSLDPASDASNGIVLRSDLHRLYDAHKLVFCAYEPGGMSPYYYGECDNSTEVIVRLHPSVGQPYFKLYDEMNVSKWFPGRSIMYLNKAMELAPPLYGKDNGGKWWKTPKADKVDKNEFVPQSLR